MARVSKKQEAKSRINAMEGLRNNLKFIHYSCESFKDKPDDYSPRISSIAVTNYSTSQTKSFSIHYVAEHSGISKATIETYYDRLEKEMLDEFFDFVRSHPESVYAHWNMSSHTFGFEAIYRRYRRMGGIPTEIPDNKIFDLNDILKGLYGSDYVDHPRMNSVLVLNGINKRNFLSGAAEAQAFEDKDFNKLHMSTIAKTEAFKELLDLQFQGKLKIKTHPLNRLIEDVKESVQFKAVEIFLGIAALFGLVYTGLLKKVVDWLTGLF